MKFKEITIQGTPYERGQAYGQQCREEIGVSIKVYGNLFQELKGISWEDARKISEFYLSKTRDFAPAYVEEMQGIADGANVDLLDIAALNARTEIMFAQLDAQECTTLSLLPPATEGGQVIAAQNWDFYRQLRDSMVILHVRQENKPNFVTVTEAGMIGGIGMNDRGIGILLNALTAEVSCQGIPLRTRMRAMLVSETLAEAYAQGSHKPTSVGHLVATHKDGIAIAFEMDSNTLETILPEDGVWVHTNHYLGPKMYQAHDAAGAGQRHTIDVEYHTNDSQHTVSCQDPEHFRSAHKDPDAVVHIKQSQHHHRDQTPRQDHAGITGHMVICDLMEHEIIAEPQAQEECNSCGQHVQQNDQHDLGRIGRAQFFIVRMTHFITSRQSFSVVGIPPPA